MGRLNRKSGRVSPKHTDSRSRSKAAVNAGPSRLTPAIPTRPRAADTGRQQRINVSMRFSLGILAVLVIGLGAGIVRSRTIEASKISESQLELAASLNTASPRILASDAPLDTAIDTIEDDAAGRSLTSIDRSSTLTHGLHVVENGDSLFGIAGRYRLTPARLAQINGRGVTDIILPGDSLWVPLKAMDLHQSAIGSDSDRHNIPHSIKVQAGETLSAIAARHGRSVEDLVRLNGLGSSAEIWTGQRLLVKGQSQAQSAAKNVLSAEAQAKIDTLEPSATDFKHRVRPGETLSAIASLYGERLQALQRYNGLFGDILQAGQEINIPAPGLGPDSERLEAGEKRIEVSVSQQRLFAYQGESLVWNFPASTGLAKYPTKRGDFAVQSKFPNAWSSAWQLWMPYWIGIYWAGPSENGIHALPIINGERLWSGYLGSRSATAAWF